jgi:hypothetical protein
VLIPAKSSDVFAVISPGVVYGIEVPGALHRFSYSWVGNLYLNTSSANTYSNRLEWRGFLEPSARLQMIFSASATQAHQHTQGTLLSSAQTAMNAVLPGTGAYVLATGDESAAYDLSPEWALLQGFGVATQLPVFDADGPRTYQLSGRLGIEHLWFSDAVGVEARGSYVRYSGAPLTAGGAPGDQSQLIGEFVGSWRHDYGYFFSSRIEAGAAHIWLLERDRQFWQPIGLAGLSYLHEEGEADLTYRHAVTSSVFLGQTFLTDEVRLRGSIPLDEDDKLFLSASVGYQHARILDVEGDLATRLDLVLGDVALGYRVLDELELAARYQHIEQTSEADLPPLPLSYTRNTALLTATIEYPPDREMPRTYREARRVDRNDALEGIYDNPTEAEPSGMQRQ